MKSVLYKIRRNVTTGDPEGDGDIGQRCKVCLEVAEETWTFVPCGHAHFCDACSSIIVGDKQPCPICREDTVTRMQIYI